MSSQIGSEILNKIEAEESPEKPQYKDLSETEKFLAVSDIFKEVLDRHRMMNLERTTDYNAELGQVVGRHYVNALLEINMEMGASRDETKKLQLAEKAASMQDHIVDMFGVEDGGRTIVGCLSEVAASMTLRSAGFKILESDKTEDMKGKIDIKADSGGGTLFLVQVKTSTEFDRAECYEILTSAEGNIELKTENAHYRNPTPQYRELGQNMVKWLAQEGESRYKGYTNVVPLIIEIPTGNNNEHCGCNMFTGAPTEEMVKMLQEKLVDIIIHKEEA